MGNNPAANFLAELFQRFATKSPKFFKVWQWISGALLAITGIPELLQMCGVDLPPLVGEKLNKFIASISSGILFMSLMTTQSKPAAVNDKGEVLKMTDGAKLPFTAMSEEKSLAKSEKIIDKVEIIGTQKSSDVAPILIEKKEDKASGGK